MQCKKKTLTMTTIVNEEVILTQTTSFFLQK